MKLKKIASLMLAGVMAISMLAGCSNNGETKPEEPATGVNATTVIAALNKDTTKNVTFAASAELQKTLEDAIKYKGTGSYDQVTSGILSLIDTDLNTSSRLPVAGNDNIADESEGKEQSFTFIVSVNDAQDYTEKYVVNELAKKIDNQNVCLNNNSQAASWNSLCVKTPIYEETVNGNKSEYYYAFSYTADVAVATASNTKGETVTYAAVTVTRTPSKNAW